MFRPVFRLGILYGRTKKFKSVNMVFLYIVRRSIYSASFTVRKNLVETFDFKRLFFKKTEKMLFPGAKKMSAYEGNGKTVAFVLNKKSADVLLVSTVSCEGFILANGTELLGSMILFPHSIISWHISKAQDVTEESLILFELLEPKIDILVFGYGNKKDYTPEVRGKFTQICKKFGLRYEALPTEEAVGVYNFLAEERRLVAAALIPPTYIDVLKFDRSKKFFLEDEEDENEEFSAITDNEKADKKFLK